MESPPPSFCEFSGDINLVHDNVVGLDVLP